jgi:hydrogenase maturation protease HycI
MDYQELNQIISRRPLIIGIGNDLRSDDGAGVILVRRIQNSGYKNTLIVEGTPENYLQKIISLPGESRLWIDAINWGGPGGECKIIKKEDIYHFAISTHNFSLSVITQFLNEFRPLPDLFLGIQPETIELGEQLSLQVERTIDELTEIFINQLGLSGGS